MSETLSHLPTRKVLSVYRGLIDVPLSSPMVADIQREVALYYGISLLDLLSERRARPVARPRQVAMWLCKQLTPKSLPTIGRLFGGRDHTTVMHAVRKIEELRHADPNVAHDCEALLLRFEVVPE
jgi:chromosomal replication initiator protein